MRLTDLLETPDEYYITGRGTVYCGKILIDPAKPLLGMVVEHGGTRWYIDAVDGDAVSHNKGDMVGLVVRKIIARKTEDSMTKLETYKCMVDLCAATDLDQVHDIIGYYREALWRSMDDQEQAEANDYAQEKTNDE